MVGGQQGEEVEKAGKSQGEGEDEEAIEDIVDEEGHQEAYHTTQADEGVDHLLVAEEVLKQFQ